MTANPHARKTEPSPIPFARPEIAPNALESAMRALGSGWLTTGPEVLAFERELAEWVGAAHGVAVSSCTAAIELSLRALRLPLGARVLSSTMTFCGAIHAIVHAGLRPVLVDVDPETQMPDPATIAAAVRREGPVEAMVALHFAGFPAAVEELAEAAGLPLARVIEDGAHALGTVVGERPVGTISSATCFSFYATKNLPIGEGGMVTTDDPEIADYVRRARLHGMNRDAWKRYGPGASWRYDVGVAGLKANMTDVQAAIGRGQLRRFAGWQARRAELADRYDAQLADVPGILPAGRPTAGRHAWHLYVIRVKPGYGIDRDTLSEELATRGIGCSVHFIPNHQHPYFAGLLGINHQDFPGAEHVFRQILSLPLHQGLADQDVDRVCAEVAGLADDAKVRLVGAAPWPPGEVAPERRLSATLSNRDQSQANGKQRLTSPPSEGAEHMEHNTSNCRANGNGAAPEREASRPSSTPRGSHVAVIGGAGFVGSVVVPKLLAQDYDVTVLDAFLYGTDSLTENACHPRLHLVRGDIRNVESVIRGCRDADAIVHLGGLVGDPSCSVDVELTREINLKSTAMIGEVARDIGVTRLVFASSCAVYGASDDVLDEHSPLAPVSIYAETKMASEQLLFTMEDEQFAPTVLRFGTFYGLSPRPRFDLVVNLLTARAVREREISIFGGSQWRPFVHVDDGAEAIIACLKAPRETTSGEVFNVGSEEQSHTLRDIGARVQTLVPGTRVTFDQAAADEANYRVSFEKIRRDLGFVPRRSLTEGILEIKAAVESNAIADYQAARYDNHKSLASGEAATLLDELASAGSLTSRS